MLKFKKLEREATLDINNGQTIFYARPRVEYKDVWIPEKSIINYRKVEKDNDNECLKIIFKDNTFSGMDLSTNLTLCKKDDEVVYNKLINNNF